MARPSTEDVEECFGPLCCDFVDRSTDLLVQPLSRSFSEMASCEDAVGVRHRANSPSVTGVLSHHTVTQSQKIL